MSSKKEPCLYCGQLGTHKDSLGFCIRYSCQERRDHEMDCRYRHRFDHLKGNDKQEFNSPR